MGHDTYAFDLLHHTGPEQSSPRRIGADAFFDGREAELYEVKEQSFKVSDQQIMTLIHFRDDDTM